MPAVSVLMLVHNGGRYLLSAVNSVLAQNWSDFELIVLDNASTDGSVDILQGLHDPRLRIRREPENRMIATGFNLAFSEAGGAYILTADADDIWLPNRIERQVALLKQHPSWQAVACATQTIDGVGNVVGREFGLEREEDFFAYSAYGTGAISPAHAYRRAFFERFAWRPEAEFSADLDFLARLNEVGSIAGDPQVLFLYRRQVGQVTQRFRARLLADEGAVRIATARRRAGLPDNLGSLVERATEGVAANTPHALIQKRLALLSHTEGWPLLTALHARRWFAAARTPRSVLAAGCLVLRASLRAGAGRGMVWRMFLQGPVRAHRLKLMS